MKINLWENIFDKYDILENIKKNGQYEISAKAINEFREARLMTKFDNASQLPKIFVDNGLSILPVSRGSYVLADDFVIRQLYYPLRLWTNNLKKPVKTIFMVYTNNMFYLYEYKFDDVQNYNSLKLSRFQRYSFEKMEISLEDIERILQNVKVVQEASIPFPQADSFERVINLCELLYKSNLTKNDITVEYGFDKRQTDYYINAGKYLDLIKEQDGIVSLSSTGRNIMDKSPTRRQLGFVHQVLQHAVFNDVLKTQLKTGSLLSKSEIINKMKTYPLFNVKGESTYTRRSSTISSWINWITSLITI